MELITGDDSERSTVLCNESVTYVLHFYCGCSPSPPQISVASNLAKSAKHKKCGKAWFFKVLLGCASLKNVVTTGETGRVAVRRPVGRRRAESGESATARSALDKGVGMSIILLHRAGSQRVSITGTVKVARWRLLRVGVLAITHGRIANATRRARNE